MALIVEDGTGVTDAESYCAVAAADKYFSDREISAWATYAPPTKEAALRKATEYIDMRFGKRFLGSKTLRDQSLCFPRGCEPVIPRDLQRACAEYALRAAVNPLVQDPLTDTTGLVIKSTSEKLGPLEEKVEYATTERDLFKPYPAADNLLKSLLRTPGLIR